MENDPVGSQKLKKKKHYHVWSNQFNAVAISKSVEGRVLKQYLKMLIKQHYSKQPSSRNHLNVIHSWLDEQKYVGILLSF